MSKEIDETDIKPLLLTPLIETGKIQEAQKAAFVSGISELDNYISYSGYLTVNKSVNSQLFFWFFCSEADCENDPVVLWLSGGPGRSSVSALFVENGPLDIRDGTLRKRPASFTNHHSVIYMDNPIGVGFSGTSQKSLHHEVSLIAEDLYVAIPQFFTLFPHLQKNKFYIAGQSYAQKYIVRLTDLILKRRISERHNFNLAGVAIGNGMSNIYTQVLYSNTVYQLGLLNNQQYNRLKAIENKLIELEGGTLQTAGTELDHMINTFFESTGFNHLDSFIQAFGNRFEEPHVMRLLNNLKWKYILHTDNVKYSPWSKKVLKRLYLDRSISETPYLEQMINNYKVLLYNGQLTLATPYRANIDYIKTLNITDAKEYDNAERYLWRVSGEPAGYVTKIGNLTEVLLRNSGRSTSRDQIEWTADMLYRFTRDMTFTEPISREDLEATTPCPC